MIYTLKGFKLVQIIYKCCFRALKPAQFKQYVEICVRRKWSSHGLLTTQNHVGAWIVWHGSELLTTLATKILLPVTFIVANFKRNTMNSQRGNSPLLMGKTTCAPQNSPNYRDSYSSRGCSIRRPISCKVTVTSHQAAICLECLCGTA